MMYYNSPRISAEVLDCSVPLTLDTYSNCSYGCLYCFSQYYRDISDNHNYFNKSKVSWVNIEKLKAIFLGGGEFSYFTKNRMVVQYGGLSDQFDEYEKKYGKTLEVLRFLKEINYPICFSTKSTWVFDDGRYVELFKGQDNWNMKISITTLNEEHSKIIERGVSSPLSRISAMAKYRKLNEGGVTLRLRPYIIGISEYKLEELVERCADAGVDAISTEFFCADLRSKSLRKNLKIMSRLAGYDIFNFYKKYSVVPGYLRLCRGIKLPVFMQIKELAEKYKLRFYVSDSSCKDLSQGGSCCGLKESWNYTRGQFTEALMIAKRKGVVYFSDIAKYLDYAKGFENVRMLNISDKFKYVNMYDYFKYIWNNPYEWKSPYRYFEGALKIKGRDDDGNLIYEYCGC